MTAPDLSAAVLRAFLHARVIHAAHESGEAMVAVWKRQRATLRVASGLKAQDVQAAYMGRLVVASHRAALWGALGVNPSDFAVMLHDDGTQTPKAKWGIGHDQ